MVSITGMVGAVEFIDREAELAWLDEGWASEMPQFRILYGRRRVGKSRLLDRFTEGKRAIVYQAVEGTSADQLRDLTKSVLLCEDDPVLRAAPLANWGQALATFSRMAQRGRLLVVLDEYQYVAESDPTLASQIQRWWSREAASLPIYLVLCGSYIRFFVENVLTGPAYGRNTGAWQLQPLGYRQAARFFPNWSHEDQLRAYAVTGGIPHYILQFDPARSLAWNVQHNVLRLGSVLYQEAELLLREELREPRVYFSILRAIADGCTRIGEIANRVGSRSDITPYLRTLEALGLAEYHAPLVGKGRRGIWAVSDPYLRFWFRFVLPFKTQTEHGAIPERVYREIVAPHLDHFVSKPTFEEICRAWVISQGNAGAITDIGEVGAWWGPVPQPTQDNPRKQAEGEIEVMAVNGKLVRLVGEAKWTREAVGFGALNHLREVLPHVPGVGPDTRLYLFGREFDHRLRAAAQAEGVTLVDVNDLYGGKR
ncbi:MAG: ATP-binding protein [Chloroflexota bacterium]